MIKNQNLLKLVTGEAHEPAEYICASSFIDEPSLFGQYLANITYLGFDKESFYFIDIDGYLIKSNYTVTNLGQNSVIVLTSTSVHPTEDAVNVLQFNLATNITHLIRKNIFSRQVAAVCS
ncbi:hypothetical protein [Rufibacter latericius]|uniref:Uncharacterized protein n=1 Tax=Rufibacter latericius TaxID=2487040 RepID=A0A3M9MNR3_9BACT|nr:hypothetical protein [Rufibacter latericius]RNI26493.1 hypothetical protein EFB08_11795 [Rufibacter latericius]